MLTRRQILRAVGGAMTVVLGGLQIACTREQAARLDTAGLADEQLLTLVAMAQRLFPHAKLDAAVYRDAVLSLAASLQRDPGRRQLLVDGIEALHEEANWLNLTPEQQTATLAAIADSPFFNAVLNAMLASIYNDERTWQLLGYGGDASRFGGYTDRGFNDIDWLPDVTSASEPD